MWWDVDFSQPRPRLRPVARRGDGRAAARRRVRSRMVSDVPLGAFLSGGVDSSAVVAFMAEWSTGAVETCSIGFDAEDHDETLHAKRIAELFATNHRTRRVAAGDFGLIDTLADAFDEPFADASAFGTYRVSELAVREGEGRALRRRRRRGDGRLSPLPAVRRRGAGAAPPARALRPRRRHARRSLSEDGLGAADASAPRPRCRRWGRGAARPMPMRSASPRPPSAARC